MAPFRGGGGIELDRNVDEGKPQMAGPERAGCHTRYSSKKTLLRAATGPGSDQRASQNPRIPAESGISGSFLYLITIFLKHAFERIGKGEPDGLARALPVVVERLCRRSQAPSPTPGRNGRASAPRRLSPRRAGSSRPHSRRGSHSRRPPRPGTFAIMLLSQAACARLKLGSEVTSLTAPLSIAKSLSGASEQA